MVARVTLENVKHAHKHDAATTIARKADDLREKALAARAVDEDAYAAVVDATALPRGSADEKAARTARLQTALGAAAAAPLAAAELAKLVAVLADRALELENANLASDLGCAAEFAAASLAASALNVRINHTFMKDAPLVGRQERELARYESETARVVKRVRFEVSRSLAL